MGPRLVTFVEEDGKTVQSEMERMAGPEHQEDRMES